MNSDANTRFWWVRHDYVTFKVPVAEGRIVLAQDYLESGFEIDPAECWYSFVHNRRDQRKIADFSSWSNGAFFVNERAFEVFEDMFLRHGRAFPVRCSNKPHFIVLVDRMHDAIDMQRSSFQRLWNDGRPLEDDISKVKHITIKPDFAAADDIFRVDHGYALSLDIVVSDRFKALYEQSNLTGLIFRDTTADDGAIPAG